MKMTAEELTQIMVDLGMGHWKKERMESLYSKIAERLNQGDKVDKEWTAYILWSLGFGGWSEGRYALLCSAVNKVSEAE